MLCLGFFLEGVYLISQAWVVEFAISQKICTNHAKRFTRVQRKESRLKSFVPPAPPKKKKKN